MVDIKLPYDLWASSMLPEGILERWLVQDGTAVDAGKMVAEVRIADALHEIPAPASGTIAIEMKRNAVIEPGSVIAQIRDAAR